MTGTERSVSNKLLADNVGELNIVRIAHIEI